MTGSSAPNHNNNNNNYNADNNILNNAQVVVDINDNNIDDDVAAQPQQPAYAEPVVWRNPNANANAGVLNGRNNVMNDRERACRLYGKALFYQTRAVCDGINTKDKYIRLFRCCYVTYFPFAFIFDIIGLIMGWFWFILFCPFVSCYGICYKKM